MEAAGLKYAMTSAGITVKNLEYGGLKPLGGSTIIELAGHSFSSGLCRPCPCSIGIFHCVVDVLATAAVAGLSLQPVGSQPLVQTLSSHLDFVHSAQL